MNNESKEGPTLREIPSQRQRVCGDCKYHKKDRMMCGHDFVTDNYSCTHPDFKEETKMGNILGAGKMIAFNSRETPSTPHWCPFLKSDL